VELAPEGRVNPVTPLSVPPAPDPKNAKGPKDGAFREPDVSYWTEPLPRPRPRVLQSIGIALLALLAAGWLLLLLVLPLAGIVFGAFENGWQAYWAAVTSPDAKHAAWLTFTSAAIALPINLAFGVGAAWLITRHDFWGKRALATLIDVPFTVSPVIGGLVFVCLYGRRGWLGPWLEERGIEIIFSWPGIVLATLFVTVPFVAKELIPLMESKGRDEEEVARSLGARGWHILFWITLPAVRWALLNGAILSTARAVGEFGAASVVSGKIRGETNTLPLHIEALYNGYDAGGAYAAATLLLAFGLFSLLIKTVAERRYPGAPRP
jgi:sulfate transport system permease protein